MKKLVERRICDMEGCEQEILPSPAKPWSCPLCESERDSCWQHVVEIRVQGKTLLICYPCLMERIPEFTPHSFSTGMYTYPIFPLQPALHISSPNPMSDAKSEGTPLALWASVKSEKARGMLVALSENKDGLTHSELRSRLGLDKKVQLGGVVHGIAVAAKHQNLAMSKVWKKEVSKVGGVRTVTYRLTNKMAEGIKEASSQEQSSVLHISDGGLTYAESF